MCCGSLQSSCRSSYCLKFCVIWAEALFEPQKTSICEESQGELASDTDAFSKIPDD